MDLGVIRNLHVTIGNMINNNKKTAVPDPVIYGLNPTCFPVLQDIDWHVADILRHQGRLPKEELVIALVDNIAHDAIKNTRGELFAYAHGVYTDIHGDDATANRPLQAKQRRGATATQAYARDLVELFYYITGLRTGFPTDVLSTNCKLPVATDSNHTEQTPEQQISNTSDNTSVTIGSASVLGDDIHQTIMELVVRCRDYDKIIIDMQCQLNAAVDNISNLQAKLQLHEKTTDSIIMQESTDEPGTHTPSCLSPESEHLLHGANASRSYTVIANDDHGMDTMPSTPNTACMQNSTSMPQDDTCSSVDISASLTGLLMCSTPDTRSNKNSQEMNEAMILGSAECCEAKDSEIEHIMTDMYILKETCKDIRHRMDTKIKSLKSDRKKDNLAIKTLKKSAEQASAELNRAKQQLEAHNGFITNIYETSEKEVPSIPCSNRFEILSQPDTDEAQDQHQDNFTEVNTRRRERRNRKAPKRKQSDVDSGRQRDHGAVRTKQSRSTKIRATIVGSSMVRGLGTMVCSDTIAACCFTNPGCRTDDIKDRIHQMTRPNDEVIVLACATNNVPVDDVPTLTAKVDELIVDTRRMRPFAKIIVPEIPRRNDSAELNRKIDNSNDTIKQICAKYSEVHYMHQTFRYSDYSRDKLHLNRSGKDIYARNLRNKIEQVMSCR